MLKSVEKVRGTRNVNGFLLQVQDYNVYGVDKSPPTSYFVFVIIAFALFAFALSTLKFSMVLFLVYCIRANFRSSTAFRYSSPRHYWLGSLGFLPLGNFDYSAALAILFMTLSQYSFTSVVLGDPVVSSKFCYLVRFAFWC